MEARREHRVKKRTPNACQRCRRQKVKCSGSAPCSNCVKRSKPCIFDSSEPSVSVSKRYLQDLEKRLAALEGTTEEGAGQSGCSPPVDVESTGQFPSTTNARQEPRTDTWLSSPAHPLALWPDALAVEPAPLHPSRNQSERQSPTGDVGITNPLSAGPSNSGFISDLSKGRLVYLGTSSNWSFSRRVLDGAHQIVHGCPLGPNNFALDGDVYSLGWDGSRNARDEDKVVLPPLKHAVYLVRSVQFHIGEVYHLLHEDTFMPELYQFYEHVTDEYQKQKLWYIHYLMIMAFGKAFTSRGVERGKPPGVEFFVQAMKLIPHVSQLWVDTFTTAEIFCCAALYLQCADFRYGAYLTIGHAMRTALFQGMHTDMPPGTFGTSQVERARNIWWTVYVLDRELSSLMGLPIQIADENITASLPSPQSTEQAAALRLHIKLCRIVAQVVSTVYGPEGRLDKRFLTSTRSALTNIAEIVGELSSSFKMTLVNSSQGLSRLAATLHLQYHQCIVLTTRPLLFSLFGKRLEAKTTSSSIMASVQRLLILLQMCADSSKHSLDILSELQKQDLLATFVPFDLESVYCSGMIALVASFVEPGLIEDLPAELEKTHRVLNDLIIRGNLIASRRMAELEQLESMLNVLKLRNSGNAPTRSPVDTSSAYEATDDVAQVPTNDIAVQSGAEGPGSIVPSFDDWTWEDALDSTQLLNVAGLLEDDQFDGSTTAFSF